MPPSLSKFSEKKCCILCNSRESDEVKFGPIYMINGIEVHYFCLLLSSSVPQNGEDNEGILGFLPNDIQSAAEKVADVLCVYCHVNGANIKCSFSRCKVTFHYPCGIANGTTHRFSGKYPSFCHKHRSVKKIPGNVIDSIKAAQCECILCMDKIEPNQSSIWAPCCQKNAVFHKNCIQRMAFSFGLYTLRCPLCNNQKKFISALLQNGIFIPEQDASWETEPNAFIELYERHSSCNAAICISPRGRDYNTKRSKNWQIILCLSCGSQGIHNKCLQNEKKQAIKKKKIMWECGLCRNADDGSDEANSESTPVFDNVDYGTIQPFGSSLPETNNNYQPSTDKKKPKRQRTSSDSDEQILCNLSEEELSHCKKCRVLLEKYQ